MIDPLNTFFRENRFFLLSLAVHTLVFVVLFMSYDHKEAFDTALEIEVVEKVPGGFVQKLSGYESQKKLRGESKIVPQNSKSPFVQDEESLSRGDTPAQHITPQGEIAEGVSDISKEGNSHQSYLERIRSKIEFHKTYPKASRILNETGLVKVKLKISKSGHVQKIEIAESSQFKRLDDAAIKAVADASPFDEFPSDVTFAAWSILIPMKFELN